MLVLGYVSTYLKGVVCHSCSVWIKKAVCLIVNPSKTWLSKYHFPCIQGIYWTILKPMTVFQTVCAGELWD